MTYYVRPMRREDIAQVADIDREAFPTQLPPPNYERELQKQMNHYLVVCDQAETVDPPEAIASPQKSPNRIISGWRKLFGRRHHTESEPPPANNHRIIGFTGFWIMADEAHISSIAVRESHRMRGFGDLLIISVINLATELKARIVTLEVRASNTAAQNLYQKFGFTRVGVRRGYYIDNREDGVIMSTEDISSSAFRKHFQDQKEAFSNKTGDSSAA